MLWIAKSSLPYLASIWAEHVVHDLGLGDVEQHDVLNAQAADDGLDEGQGLLVLVGDDDLGTGLDTGFGNSGGDGLFVGDAGDQAYFAFEIDDGFHGGLLGMVKIYCTAANADRRIVSRHCYVQLSD
jgi:hypothetical protein